ncbi:hypothetical protein GA0116948_10857 [Chitinophaga costaii]|uniref:Uncharacterized protein n=1 Tax=Chitinophaga costaii TaxID=1335309 RepID=A0A1C4EET2_9BACT|nr:hypothetical protein GA0116948_10857 [Chitinophaga costaii]
MGNAKNILLLVFSVYFIDNMRKAIVNKTY